MPEEKVIKAAQKAIDMLRKSAEQYGSRFDTLNHWFSAFQLGLDNLGQVERTINALTSAGFRVNITGLDNGAHGIEFHEPFPDFIRAEKRPVMLLSIDEAAWLIQLAESSNKQLLDPGDRAKFEAIQARAFKIMNQ